MELKERIKALCKENGISMNKLEDILGFGKGYISKLGKSTPNAQKIQQIADYFGVTLDYLLNGTTENKYYELNERDEKDIAKRLKATLEDLENNDGLMFSGEPLDEETKELLRASLENSIRIAKINAKKKFTPKKYRK